MRWTFSLLYFRLPGARCRLLQRRRRGIAWRRAGVAQRLARWALPAAEALSHGKEGGYAGDPVHWRHAHACRSVCQGMKRMPCIPTNSMCVSYHARVWNVCHVPEAKATILIMTLHTLLVSCGDFGARSAFEDEINAYLLLNCRRYITQSTSDISKFRMHNFWHLFQAAP